MSISEVFIRRPIATSLVSFGIAGLGLLSYRGLPVSDVPNIDLPTLTVTAALPGASPDTMAATVASPLERQFTTIAGLDEMTSSSNAGATTIALQFDLDRDIDGAAVDVQTAIAAAMPLLPAGMPAPPSFRKFNPAAQPVMFLDITSPSLPMWSVNDYAETRLAPRLTAVPGVSQALVQGAQRYAVRVQVDPNRLHAHRLGLNDVSQALQDWNVNLPTGQLYAPHSMYNITVGGQLMNAEAFEALVVAYRNGAPIRLGQVARIIDGVEDTRQAMWRYTKTSAGRAIFLSINRQPGSNTVEISDHIRELMPTLQAMLPADVRFTLPEYDYSKTIREAFSDIRWTMLATMALVVAVIFAFLHDARATLIPALALPLSLCGAFIVIDRLGYSLNNVSMMALILSIGFVVDDAIVMLENIVRHLEHGAGRLQAALDGSREIGFTILSMTISLAAVFIPILFMSGVLGRLFREFAVTIVTAILTSGIVSLTLTPMLCSRFLRTDSLHSKSWFSRRMEAVFACLFRAYQRSLAAVLRHRTAMIVVFVGVLAGTIEMFRIVPKGFIPDQDNDTMTVVLQAAQGTSFDEMISHMKRVTPILNANDDIAEMFVTVNGSAGPMNQGRFGISLKPRRERRMTAQALAQRLRQQLAPYPGFRAFVTMPPAIQIGARQSTGTYSLTVRSSNTQELYDWAKRLERAIATLPEVQDVSDDLQMTSPRIELVIDRDKAVAVGLNASEIQDALYDGLGPRWASTIYGPVSQYKVLLELAPQFQQQADSLRDVAFKTSNGRLVPLESVVRLHTTVGPQTVNHVGQLPAVSISFTLRPGISLGTAVERIQETASHLLPPTVTTDFQGSAKTFQQSMKNLGLLLFIAIGVVYIVLGMLYESYVHPLTILSGLPSAGLGALVTLYLFGDELNVYSFVGLILLIGLVKKNAIMQVDVALELERRHGRTPAEAIYEGCLVRFRPIMMTTMAALVGAWPIALGWGAGGEARRPLGLAVVGGLLVSQLITLYLTPVVYTQLASLAKPRRAH